MKSTGQPNLNEGANVLKSQGSVTVIDKQGKTVKMVENIVKK